MRFAPHRTVSFTSAALAAALFTVAPSSARGDIVFNNFGAADAFGNSGRLLQGESVGTIGDVDQAVSFTVGGSPYNLTLVSLGINIGGPGVNTGLLDVEIWSNAAGLPGAALDVVTLNVNSQGKQIVTANFGGSPQLSAGTTYWIVADARTTLDGGWNFNSTGDVGNTAGRSDNGPWSLRVDDDRMALRVEGTLVPEPASVAMLGLAAAAGLGRRRARN
jgi:hypothetical protein